MTGTALISVTTLALALGANGALAEMRLDGFEQPVANTRDGRFNRAVTRGKSAGASAASVANSVTVSQGGRGNTLYLIVDQVNSGAVRSGVALNGDLSLD